MKHSPELQSGLAARAAGDDYVAATSVASGDGVWRWPAFHFGAAGSSSAGCRWVGGVRLGIHGTRATVVIGSIQRRTAVEAVYVHGRISRMICSTHLTILRSTCFVPCRNIDIKRFSHKKIRKKTLQK